MQDKNLIHIKVSKVIHAEKWRVVRLLTKVWEFPTYIATVKESSVIHRTHNKMRTKWRVQIDSIPISWVEEDTLCLQEDAIYFEAIEGDLEKFKGQWKFQDHPEGTEVAVDVHLNVGIPAIKDFADIYIERLLTRNFEAILGAVERRLISIRYADFKRGDATQVAGFGILGHFYNFNHLARCLKSLNPQFKMPSREFLSKLFTITPSFRMYDMKEFKSKAGAITRGCFIVCTFIPDMLSKDIYAVYSKVVRACKLAEKYGVGIVTLGGFASMVGERLGHQIVEEVDIPITTGNTYTASLAVAEVEKAAKLLEKDLRDLKVAIVGGTGDVGSACSRALSEKAKELTITGKTKSTLRLRRNELRKRHKAKIEATTDNKKAVSDADVVIAAANVSASIININWFKPGAVICDLAYPKNISYTPTERKDILIFSGGLASIPEPIDTGVDMGLPSPQISYGCFCEAIILALEHRFENYSYGRGNIFSEKMDEILQLGRRHGFEPAPFFWADQLIEKGQIEEIKKSIK
ncbi:MAG: NAD(P)-binding domain-containing protein [Candidatus Omnitrophota bacterium]|nr:MAG: NAD(P)-binding domain-containing protein [Candidatus Omnitrophota bacterium]